MIKLPPLGAISGCFNINDMEKFRQGIKLIQESLTHPETFFCSDNIITWNKNLSFLREEFYLDIVKNPSYSAVEKRIVWRTYIVLYFAELCKKIKGDYLELGCHTGFTAEQVVRKIDFKELKKKYFLYDLFEWNEGDKHTRLPGHENPKMYDDIKNRFMEYPFVEIVKGAVPASFKTSFPEKIAFAHIDMNSAEAESGALKEVLPRLSKGAAIVLDDYGWWGYSEQKVALDPIIAENHLKILELPTGQGLILKN